MFDFAPPLPIVLNKNISDCEKGVIKHDVVFWGGISLRGDISQNFYCGEGKREINLDNPSDCEGCQFHTPNPERR